MSTVRQLYYTTPRP